MRVVYVTLLVLLGVCNICAGEIPEPFQPPKEDEVVAAYPKGKDSDIPEAVRLAVERAREHEALDEDHPMKAGKKLPKDMPHPEDIDHPHFGDVPPDFARQMGEGKSHLDYKGMSPNEQLDKAVVEHDVRGIRDALEKGASPVHKRHGTHHRNVIVQAAESGYSTLETILTWNNSYWAEAVNTPLEDGHTPLHESILHGRSAHGAVYNLLKAGADCSHVGPLGFSAVHYTAMNPHVRTVMGRFMDVLLKYKCAIDVPDPHGRTAVHLVAMAANPQNLQSLAPVTTAAMLKQKDKWGMTPIDVFLARPPIGSVLGIFFRKISEDALAMAKTTLREPLSRPGPPAQNGGWYYPPSAVKYDIDHCEIDRIDVSELSAERFLSHYYSIRRPFILTGATKDWRAHFTLSKKVLKGRYGKTVMRAGERPQALLWGQDGKKMKLKDFIKQHMIGDKYKYHPREYPWQVDEHEITKSRPEFVEEYRLPAPLGICSPSASQPEFYLGPVHADSMFLANGHSTWDAVIYGRRRVVFAHETVKIKTNRYEHLVDFLNKKDGYQASRKVDNLYECTQSAGEILVTPAGWRTAFVNVAETVGLRQEFCNGKLNEMHKGHDHSHLVEDYYGDFDADKIDHEDNPDLPPDA